MLLLVLERAWEAWERKKTIYEVRQTRVCTLNVSYTLYDRRLVT